MKYKYLYKSKIGNLYFISDGKYVIKIILDQEKDLLKDIGYLEENPNLKEFVLLKKWFDNYFNNKIPNLEVPIKLIGTDFQKEVWSILKDIPYGETITYKEIVDIIKNKYNLKNMSPQAVGNAVGKNPLLILIPCHRVLGSDKTLKGFRVGLDIKEKLLNIENIYYRKE